MKKFFHLAQINIARMKGVNIDDPIMQEFVDNLDKVNALAERSEGFVWRLKDDSNNATNLNPYDDEQPRWSAPCAIGTAGVSWGGE